VLDAGTGLRQLTSLLGTEAFRGSVLLGHLHWDHVQGMPFFDGGARPGSRVDVRLPSPDADPLELLARAFSPPHFPIEPTGMGAGWTFEELVPGPCELEGFSVLVQEIPHKGGRTFGFRVADATGSVAYLSDHDPVQKGGGTGGIGEYHEAAVELAAGVDLLIHDAQFLRSELPDVGHLGHATVEYALGLAERCSVRQLLLYHHAPNRTDDDIDAIVSALPASPVLVTAAVESTFVTLPSSA
jgi:phosphoribosyl 1,2-cyclic phosphodiesterase